ncbi:type III-A CRISPR-associated RAMP protein Csm5 [Thermococci archaeon]|nr:MAG: type III-A CRISPR-associated RAMP protein Csm5 [Thermococci archaeon]
MNVLTPLHVGNGNELTPVDFYPRENEILVLDVGRLVYDLQKLGADIEEILGMIRNPAEDLYVWKKFLTEYKINPEQYAKYKLKVRGKIGRMSSRITEFIKESGKPYIPGSSIKGAIRTAVMYEILKECGDTVTVVEALKEGTRIAGKDPIAIQELIRSIGHPANHDILDYYIHYINMEIKKALQRRKKVNLKTVDDLLEAIVFGFDIGRGGIRHEPKRDPMRALIVRDSSKIPLNNLAVYEVRVIGADVNIPVWVEALEPNTRFNVEIIFDKELAERNSDYFNGLLWHCKGKELEEFIWKAVEDFYRELAKIDGIRGSNLLRIGWGKGWISNTIGLLLKRKGQKWEQVRRKLGLGRKPGGKGISSMFPKTRRIANGMPMGWVEI